MTPNAQTHPELTRPPTAQPYRAVVGERVRIIGSDSMYVVRHPIGAVGTCTDVHPECITVDIDHRNAFIRLPHGDYEHVNEEAEEFAKQCEGADSTAKALKPKETVNHPAHYNKHPSGVECIDVIEHMSFNVGNAVKYLWRADHKGNQIEDLKKAAWYVNREIEKLTKGK